MEEYLTDYMELNSKEYLEYCKQFNELNKWKY